MRHTMVMWCTNTPQHFSPTPCSALLCNTPLSNTVLQHFPTTFLCKLLCILECSLATPSETLRSNMSAQHFFSDVSSTRPYNSSLQHYFLTGLIRNTPWIQHFSAITATLLAHHFSNIPIEDFPTLLGNTFAHD